MDHQRDLVWTVAQTIPGKEASARFHLGRQGFSVFGPKLPSTIKSGRAYKQCAKPLFPGYLFVGFGSDRMQWRSIRGTFGVSKLVTFGDRPAQMPEGSVEQMLERSDADECIRCDHPLMPGDHIRLMGGPFNDWLGQVVNIPASDRIVVLIDMMSRQLPLTVNRSQLRVTESPVHVVERT